MNSEPFFLADRLLHEGDARAAVDVFRDIVEAAPEHVAAWRKYAEALELTVTAMLLQMPPGREMRSKPIKLPKWDHLCCFTGTASGQNPFLPAH